MTQNSRPVQIGSIAVLVLCQAACAPKAAQTVDYYRAHAEERETQMKKCSGDPAVSRESEACKNARDATGIEGVGSLRNLPSLGLPAPAGKPEATTK